LSTEYKLVQQVENVPLVGGMIPCSSSKPDAITEIARDIDQLRQMTQETGEDLRKMEQDQEAFALHYHECTKSNGKHCHVFSKYFPKILFGGI